MRVLHNDTQGYDDQADSWFGFDTPEQAQLWAAEIEPAVDYGPGPSEVIRTVSVAPAFNAYSMAVTCLAAPAVVGPVVNLAQGDEGRIRLVVNTILPAGSYLLVGTREAVIAGQGYPLQVGVQLELKNTRAVWAVLALGTATGPITGTVGVLTESLVG